MEMKFLPSKDYNARMSLYEYQEKYSRKVGKRELNLVLRFGVAAIGVVLFAALASVSMRAYEISPYLGYAFIALSVILFVGVYIVPLVRLSHMDAFQTHVTDKESARSAKRHNRRMLRSIADHMIELNREVDEADWYPFEKVDALAAARSDRDDDTLRTVLGSIYRDDIGKSAKVIIRNAAVKSGVTSALSQSDTYDTIFVTTINLQLIKDLVFLYGFRPSDARLAKILKSVLTNSLIAYGISNVNFGDSLVRGLSKYIKGLPLFGSAISVVTDSAIQGATNATLTTIVGYQTKKYLYKEYHLQELLEDIDLGNVATEAADAEEMNETIEEAKSGVKKVFSSQEA